MSNHITVSELRNNYDHYMERMESGEIFVIKDIDKNKKDLYKPLDDNRGIPIDVERVNF